MNPFRRIAEWWAVRRGGAERAKNAQRVRYLRELAASLDDQAIQKAAAAVGQQPAPQPQQHPAGVTPTCPCPICAAARAGVQIQTLALDVAEVQRFVRGAFEVATSVKFCNAHTVQMLGSGVAEVTWLCMTPETWRLLQPALEVLHQRHEKAKRGTA